MSRTRMREIHIDEPGALEAVVETLGHAVVMVQLPTVFVLLAPPNREGVEWLNRTKVRLPNKNYGTALGSLETFHAMALPGTLPPELDSVEGLKLLTGAFIRITVAPHGFNSAMIRAGTAQGVLLEGAHRRLFTAVEESFAGRIDPGIMAGHSFAAPLCTSANISGDPDGSITAWDRAYAFGVERDIPLVVRSEPDLEQTGSYPIFWLQRDSVRIERAGPRLEEIKAGLPARLFAQHAASSTAAELAAVAP